MKAKKKEKKTYSKPALVRYGAMQEITKGGTMGDLEGAATNNMNKRI